MAIRGIRGANEVAANTEEAILTATRDLLIAMQQANGFSARDIVSAVFTLTPDLNAAFPARAARELLGWVEVPLLCASEIDVPGAPGHLVRVLLHVDSEGGGAARSVYLGSAKALRPDHDDRPATPEMGEQRSVQRMRRQDVEGHGEGRGPVVAIDGPAGAGKSTVARAVARRLGCLYLDSGAMYRALALAALRAGVELGDGPALERLAARVDITLQPGADGSRVLLGGEDVTDAVRAPDVEEVVPRVAGIPGVRAVMIAAQRRLARMGGVVMDGRDIGRVVLPEADCKVYLTADLAVRVRRRYLQLRGRGRDADLEEVGRDLARRDEFDRQQMVKAPDAVEVDTTDLGVEASVERILALCPGGARRAGN